MKRRAVRRYRTPRYPAAKELRGSPQLPPPTLPGRVTNAAFRAAAPLAIAATAAASAPSDAPPSSPAVVSQQDARDSSGLLGTLRDQQETRVRTLTWQEIEALVGELRSAAAQQAPAIEGDIAIEYEFLTEEEVRLLVDAFFTKNGITLNAPGRVGGIEADAWNADLRIGYEYTPAEEITEEQRRDLDLLRAQGDAAVLVLDRDRFAYEAFGWAGLPGKREAVTMLHRELQRHLEWLVERGWVSLDDADR